MHAHETLDEVSAEGRLLREAIPATYAAWSELQGAVMQDGVLDRKTKELIALAISVTRECDGCIASHARSAVRAGLTGAEVAEAMSVTIMMNGGPGTVWGPRAFAAFEEFFAEAS